MGFTNITIGQLTGAAAGVVGIIATAIQLSPIKLNPWSALARAVGRAINREVIDKVDAMEEDLRTFKNVEEERAVKSARARILRFGDEIVHGVRHSKEHFDDILDDITDYERYCAEHKEFKNNRTKLTSNLINKTYEKCMLNHDFI